MQDAYGSKIVMNCTTVEEAVKSEAFFEVAGLLLLNFHSPERVGVVDTFKKVRRGQPITFSEYEQLYAQVFDIRFMDACKKHFNENILWTQNTFEKISVDSLRKEFLVQLTKSLVLWVLEWVNTWESRRVSGFWSLEVYKTGALYLVKDISWEVHSLSYLLPTSGDTDMVFFEKDGKFVMFQPSTGKYLSDDFSFHSTFDFAWLSQTWLFVNADLQTQRLITKLWKTLYSTPQNIKFFPQQSVFLEWSLWINNCFALEYRDGRLEKYQVQRDVSASNDEKEVFFYMVWEQKKSLEVVLPPKKKFA